MDPDLLTQVIASLSYTSGSDDDGNGKQRGIEQGDRENQKLSRQTSDSGYEYDTGCKGDDLCTNRELSKVVNKGDYVASKKGWMVTRHVGTVESVNTCE